MPDDFRTAFCAQFLLRFPQEFGLTRADLNRIDTFLAGHPKAVNNAALAIDCVEEAAKTKDDATVPYCLAIAERFYAEHLEEPTTVPDRWMAAYQRQKKRVAELVEEHFSVEHYLKYHCKGDVCMAHRPAPSGAQGGLL